MIRELTNELIDTVGWDVGKEKKRTKEVMNDLKDTLESIDRPFLCANEIGRNERICCLKFTGDDGKPVYMFSCSPIVTEISSMTLNLEEDYTNGKKYIVPRNNEIKVMYLNTDGDPIANKLTDSASCVLSRAIETMRCVTIDMYGLEWTDEFAAMSQEEQESVIDHYLKVELPELQEKLTSDEDVKNDKNFKDYEFAKAVSEGKVEFTDSKKDRKINRKERRSILRFLRKKGK